MNVTIILADSAQVAGGKLYLLGGNWRITNGRSPSVVVLLIEANWNEANRHFHFMIELIDADGKLYTIETPNGSFPQKYFSQITFGRPAELPVGSMLSETLIFQVPPLFTLKPTYSYEWRCTIDGEFAASKSFTTRPEQNL